jgi:hypothetical protein
MVQGLQNWLSNYLIYTIDICIELESVKKQSILTPRPHVQTYISYITYITTHGCGFFAITRKLFKEFIFHLNDILFFLNPAGFTAHTMQPVYVKITEPVKKKHV